jgi:hypothetical protein
LSDFQYYSKSDFYLFIQHSLFFSDSSLNYFGNDLLIKHSELFNLVTLYVSDLQTLSSKKNNFDELIELYPSYYLELNNFEFLSHDEDGSLYAHLSIPDRKFFYPEPFIASPSFVHEDL